MTKLNDDVMKKIDSNEVEMKPKAYFVLLTAGLAVFTVLLFFASAWFTNLLIFKFRSHGLFEYLKYGTIGHYFFVGNIPFVLAFIAMLFFIAGLMLLKYFDFSYKGSLLMMGSAIVITTLIAAFLIDSFGLNEIFEKNKTMCCFYETHYIDKDRIIGSVQKTGRNGYIVLTANGKLFRVLTDKIPQMTLIQFEQGECLEAVGKFTHYTDIFNALTVRRCPEHYLK